MIGEGDALNLKIPFDIDEGEAIYGWGGCFLIGHKINGMDVYFKTNDKKVEKLTLTDIRLTESRKMNEKVRAISQSLPSVIGVDFLLKNGFRLVLDPCKNNSYFEKN